ncbi:MAG: hypothetical protein JXJ17_14610 [Anaerolineae bacterium]|nr:hypothetical protein [Anaerolineae bacterium]
MYVLVISRERNRRRLYVDNLIARGYLAAGVASVDEGTKLLNKHIPSLVMICQLAEEDTAIDHLRNKLKLASTPVVITSVEPPVPEWMTRWKIDAYIPFGDDIQHFIKKLKPWLPSLSTASQ